MHSPTIKKYLLTFLCSTITLFSSLLFAQENEKAYFLSISDLHFNPFYSCSEASNHCEAVDKLRAAPVKDWAGILESYDKENQVYNKDTGFQLFKSALAEFKKQKNKKHPRFVLLLGDFISHDFSQTYIKYTGDTSAEGLQSFIHQTLAFTAHEFKKVFADTDVFAVVGNNDAYIDYVSNPIFYKKTAPLWSSLIKETATKEQMKKEFSDSGYYAVTIPGQKNLRLIVLNSTLFSAKAPLNEASAKAQLNWLHQQLLTLAPKHQKALIAMHISASVDIYKTIKQNQLVSLWKLEYAQAFLNDMNQFAYDIVGVFPGHSHMDWFQYNKSIFISATPAISPQFGNNPGFKVYQYRTQALTVADYVTYFYALNANRQWAKEYDFNQRYQPFCKHCQIIDGMQFIQQTGELADNFKTYYAVNQNSQPITLDNKWLPYYWCAVHFIDAGAYQACLNEKILSL